MIEPATGGDHGRQDGPRDEEDAADVDREDAVPQLDRGLVEHADPGDAGVVEQDVDPAEALDDVAGQRLGGVRVGHVDAEVGRDPAGLAISPDGLRGGRAIDVGDGDAGTFGGEEQRRRAADPGPAPVMRRPCRRAGRSSGPATRVEPAAPRRHRGNANTFRAMRDAS